MLLALCVTALTWSDTKAAAPPANDVSFRNHLCTYFRCLDANCNGKAEIEDFVIMFFRVPNLSLNPWKLLSNLVLQAKLIRQFANLFPLTDNDLEEYITKNGPVTKDQFIESMTKRRNTDRLRRQITALVDFVHDTFSSRRWDKALTLADYGQIYRLFGIDEDALQDGFNALDANNDGNISKKECLDAALIYFNGADPNDPSNLWAGPVWQCADVPPKKSDCPVVPSYPSGILDLL